MFYHREPILRPGGGARTLHPAVQDETFQNDLLAALAGLTSVELPAGDSRRENT